LSVDYDYIVIGGGLGGYPAAIELARRGGRVAIIEKGLFGGECANYGCIPTKALLHAAGIIHDASRTPGIEARVKSFKEIVEWRNSISKKLSMGVEWLLRKYGVDVYKGVARLEDPEGTVTVEKEGSTERIRGSRILLATGSEPAYPPMIRVDHVRVLDNRSVLKLKEIPESIVIVGGGPIGVEYACVFSALGSKVTIVEMLPTILYGMDEDCVSILLKQLRSSGVNILLNSPIEDIEVKGGRVLARVKGGVEVEAEYALIATGRKPATRGVGLENAGVKVDRKGYIIVDEGMRTSNPRIYAAGDVTGPPFLAHRAYYQSLVAASNMAGEERVFNKIVPSVVYSIPQVAGVGLTEEEAREKGVSYGKSVFKYAALGRALIESGGVGMIKILYSRDTGRLLGVHAVGPSAETIISEATLALELKATVEDIASIIKPHPTMHEALKEAAELAIGKPIHMYVKPGSKSS